MTPEEINRAVAQVVPGGAEVDTLQVVMYGPYLAEVKARVADGQWYQGMVRIRVERDVIGGGL